jgi:hypothetical protein
MVMGHHASGMTFVSQWFPCHSEGLGTEAKPFFRSGVRALVGCGFVVVHPSSKPLIALSESKGKGFG